MSFFKIYKKGQGKYTRWVTFLSVMLLAAIGAYLMSKFFEGYAVTASTYVRYGVPVVVIAGLALLTFWLVNRPRSADFLIATEGEMKKVSWSSKKEIVGSTKVVIVTTLLMAVLLFAVDVLFAKVFNWIGVI